ncbi:MAG TPA: coproporphyrinogen III oxidase family protein, partial [Edaphobacter sp.]|nr:coproporphyrinogen III oxidase family protein [Edaphobacter sp.]
YWRRLPYIGFGLDAHSMLCTDGGAVRFQSVDELSRYMAGPSEEMFSLLGASSGDRQVDRVSGDAAFEEMLFLGLRMVEGVKLSRLREEFGEARVATAMPAIQELCDAAWMRTDGDVLQLTARGRLVSNEVFSRLLIPDTAEV